MPNIECKGAHECFRETGSDGPLLTTCHSLPDLSVKAMPARQAQVSGSAELLQPQRTGPVFAFARKNYEQKCLSKGGGGYCGILCCKTCLGNSSWQGTADESPGNCLSLSVDIVYMSVWKTQL